MAWHLICFALSFFAEGLLFYACIAAATSRWSSRSRGEGDHAPEPGLGSAPCRSAPLPSDPSSALSFCLQSLGTISKRKRPREDKQTDPSLSEVVKVEARLEGLRSDLAEVSERLNLAFGTSMSIVGRAMYFAEHLLLRLRSFLLCRRRLGCWARAGHIASQDYRLAPRADARDALGPRRADDGRTLVAESAGDVTTDAGCKSRAQHLGGVGMNAGRHSRMRICDERVAS